jgi:hypothetical protein
MKAAEARKAGSSRRLLRNRKINTRLVRITASSSQLHGREMRVA